jgi:membrane carboxypeptidase/penicillin-binding protein
MPVTYSKTGCRSRHVGEMVRARVEHLFGQNWANAGLQVIHSSRTAGAANTALRDALYDYERRHGYGSPLRNWILTPG